MKKRNLTPLRLNKKSISNFKVETLKGGLTPTNFAFCTYECEEPLSVKNTGCRCH